jgi:hypothetical protein
MVSSDTFIRVTGCHPAEHYCEWCGLFPAEVLVIEAGDHFRCASSPMLDAPSVTMAMTRLDPEHGHHGSKNPKRGQDQLRSSQ